MYTGQEGKSKSYGGSPTVFIGVFESNIVLNDVSLMSFLKQSQKERCMIKAVLYDAMKKSK
jgi:hypothetical protein